MAFDPRSVMLHDGHYPWDGDEKAEPRAELSPEQRGPRERKQTVFSFDLGEAWEKVARWWGGAGQGS